MSVGAKSNPFSIGAEGAFGIIAFGIRQLLEAAVGRGFEEIHGGVVVPRISLFLPIGSLLENFFLFLKCQGVMVSGGKQDGLAIGMEKRTGGLSHAW